MYVCILVYIYYLIPNSNLVEKVGNSENSVT